MEQILFIDACMRGPELSRTYRLCRRFLEEYTARRPDTEVVHRDLSRCDLPLLTGELAQQRGNWGADHPLLAPAREVAAADLILLGPGLPRSAEGLSGVGQHPGDHLPL